jgi:hypothetical protein
VVFDSPANSVRPIRRRFHVVPISTPSKSHTYHSVPTASITQISTVPAYVDPGVQYDIDESSERPREVINSNIKVSVSSLSTLPSCPDFEDIDY